MQIYETNDKRKIIKMTNKLILILALFGLNTAVFAQLDRSVTPKAQPNPEIKIEIPDAMSFSNGIKVLMVENHKLPKVSFQLFIDYPETLEGDKAGLSSIVGEMLEAGTKDTPKDAFDEKIDYIGATFIPNSRGFYASSLKKHTPELLKLLNEVLTQPAFEQEDFDRIIAQNLSGLASIPSDANTMSSNVIKAVNYGPNHPYGEQITEETLGNITLDDVKAFHKKNFIPNNAYLIIVGDITRDDVKGYVGEYFEPWMKGDELSKTDFIVPTTKGKNVVFVEKPGAVQSVIKLTHTVELTPGHPDEIKLSLLNQILGGGSFSARLMSNLREDKAYTYGCYSNISSDPLVGRFSAGGSFRNEVTDSAIVQIMDEIEKIANSTVTDKELDLVKKSMTGAFARSLENPQTIARFALNTIRYNLPLDYYSTYLLRLEKITKNDLLMVASEYLTPNNINMVVVGNLDIAEKLTVFDDDGKIDYRNYYGEEVEQLKDVAEGVTAQSVIDNYVMKTMMATSAEGLADKMKSIRQIETISKAELKEMNAQLYAYNASGASNKTASFILVKSPMGNQVAQKEWFDGTSGGSIAGGKATVYEGEELADKMKPRFPVDQVRYVNDTDITTELMGIADVDGVDHYKIKVMNKEEVSYEFYNVQTGLLTIEESYTTGEDGETSSVIVTYSDFQEYGGMLLPKNTVLNTQGQVLNFEVVSRKMGKKAKAKGFSGNFKKIEKLLKKMN